MVQAVDCLSTSAPNQRPLTEMTTDFGPCIFSPGGFSYESSSTSIKGFKGHQGSTTLKQAKGTGRQVSEPNQKSYSQLKQVAQQTPGAEIRMQVQQ